jgi:hypothetical protein
VPKLRAVYLAMLTVWIALYPVRASSADAGGLARELLQGCLAGPNKDGMAKLAVAVGATPYSNARTQHELGQQQASTVVDDDTRPKEAQRTETSVTAFVGWDLPGPGTGSLEYSEGNYRMARVEVDTGELITAWRAARTRECRIAAPVANARASFELYETLQHGDHGILISADRRWVSIFTFDPDHYDIELHFQFDAPLAGLPADTAGQGMSRLVLTDGGPRFDGDPGPGIAKVKLTRAALASGLDHPADMTFNNMESESIVQRLSQAQVRRPGS